MRARALAVGTAATLAAAAFAAPTAAQEQVPLVRIPLPVDDPGLTPYTFRVNYALVALVYDTLTWRDEDGVPRPWLARSVRRDALTVTVELRRDARWHDGRPVTADDVVFTYRHVTARPHPRFTPQVREIRSVTAVDRDTVRFRLRRPGLGFLDQPLADVPILPRHLWEDLPAGRLAPPGPPVGSGPYRLVRHDRRRLYRFEAVDGYFLGRPTARRIEVPILGRAQQMVDALKAGRADAILAGPVAGELRSPGVDAVEGVSYTGTVLALNTAEPPFDSAAARRAVAQAIDLGRVARAVAGGATAVGIQPADRGYLSPQSRWAPGTRLHRPDPGRARVAFAELGIPRISVLAPAGNPVAVAAGRQVVLAVHRAGGRARLLTRSPAAVADAVGEDGSPPDYQAAVLGAPALASYDPAFLRALFGPGELLNLSGYRSAEFDRIATRLASSDTDEERRAATAAVLARLARDAPVVPLVYADARFAFRPAIFDGWQFVRGTGIVDKRSFLPRPGKPLRRTAAASRDPVDPLSEDDPSLLPFILGSAALLCAAVLVVLFRRRTYR